MSTNRTKEKDNYFYILTISLVAAIAGLLMGFDTGVISGALQFIANTFHLTAANYVAKEFIVSAVPIGALFGAILSSIFTQRYGRRNTILTTAILFIVGTLITVIGLSVSMVIFGRLIMGFAVGLSAMAVPMYLSEISPIHIRGSMVFLFQLAITIGLMLAFIINYLFAASENWHAMFSIGIVLALLLGIGVVFLPKSPRWLLLKNYEQGAITTLQKLRARNDIHHELNDIKTTLSHQKGHFLGLFKPPFSSLVILTFGLFVFQQLSGINTILYYAATIFTNAGFNGSSGAILASIATGAVNVVSTIIAVWIIDFIGRRKLLFIGFIGMIVCLSLLGFAYLGLLGKDFHLVALISVLAFIMFFAISLGGIPYVMMAEVFPLRYRNVGMATASCANWGFNILVSASFLSLVHFLSIGTTFLLYAGCTLVGLIFSYFLVPETKDHSLEEIENNLYAGKKLRDLGDKIDDEDDLLTEPAN